MSGVNGSGQPMCGWLSASGAILISRLNGLNRSRGLRTANDAQIIHALYASIRTRMSTGAQARVVDGSKMLLAEHCYRDKALFSNRRSDHAGNIAEPYRLTDLVWVRRE